MARKPFTKSKMHEKGLKKKTWIRKVRTMPEGTVVLILSKVMSLVAMPQLSKKCMGVT